MASKILCAERLGIQLSYNVLRGNIAEETMSPNSFLFLYPAERRLDTHLIAAIISKQDNSQWL